MHMGLLDAVLGQVLGGMTQGTRQMPQRGGMGGSMGGGLGGMGMAAIIALGLQLLQRNGGLEGVLGKLRQTGHGQEADSWVGKGQNMPVTPDVLAQIFGRDEVGRTAKQLGVDPDEALGGLANVFPEIVNQITPQGRVEADSDDLVSRALQELQQTRKS
jgi:uncharacterized protein YidB (DUF937 family)